MEVSTKINQSTELTIDQEQFYSIEAQTERNIGFEPKNPLSHNYFQLFHQISHGYLPKKTHNLTWQIRYFVLTPHRLIYYTDENRAHPKGCFNFGSLLEYNIQLSSDYPQLKLIVALENQKQLNHHSLLRLLVEDRVFFNHWRNNISKCINTLYYDRVINSKRFFPKLQRNQILSQSHFWNSIHLSLVEFESFVGHLDIIFFRNTVGLSTFQRFVSGSYYDHVGILFRDESHRIHILEATQDRGVWIREWTEVMNEISQTNCEIGYRKLIFKDKRKESQAINHSEMQELLNKIIGKRYELNLTKLLSLGSQQQETYFCSELVGDLYLKLGLVRDKKRGDFWPKDLERQLKLEKGASLSPLFCIQF